MPRRIVFMGTPHFAIPTLQWLIDEYSSTGENGGVVGVFTQPDRPSGRGRNPQASPVKMLAQEHELTVLEPASLRTPEALAELKTLKPDVIVVAAFGQILPTTVLEVPPFGSLNVHASLLPRWRGAAPVAAALLAGDDTTGVTIMKMDAGLDTGPILSQRSVDIDPQDTRSSLTSRLAQLGAELLRDTLPGWFTGNLEPQPQDDTLATYAHQIKKEQGRIDWNESADDIDRRVRAFHPWPGAFTRWQGKSLKILRATAMASWQGEKRGDLLPGTVIAGTDDPVVITGRGALRLLEVQLAGKRPMAAADFVRGAREFVGVRLE